MFWGKASGGVRRYIEAKRAHVRRQDGWHHSLLVPGRLANCRQDGPLTTCSRAAPPLIGGHGYRFPLRTGPWVEALCALRPDVIETGDPYRLPWAALQARDRLGVPAVGFFHSDLQRLMALRFGGWTTAPVRRYMRHLYDSLDWVFAPSQVMAGRLRDLGIERVSAQPLGVDTRQFSPMMRDISLRSRLGLSDEARLLVFAGRNAIEKNLEVLIEAVRRLGKPYHLLLIGPDMPQVFDPRVAVIDYVADPSTLAGLLAGADALVHAGDMETFGLVILEAMASGLPVIGVDSGAVPELVDESVGALARPRDAASLAEAVADVFARAPIQLGINARHRAVHHYDWSACFATLFARLEQLRASGRVDDNCRRAVERELPARPTASGDLLAHPEQGRSGFHESH